MSEDTGGPYLNFSLHPKAGKSLATLLVLLDVVIAYHKKIDKKKDFLL